MGRVGEHSLTRRRRRAGALATASPTTRRRPTHYAHYLSARGGRRHSPTSPLAGGPLTTRTNLVRGVAGGTHPLARSPSAGSAPPPALAASVQEPSTSTAPAMSPAGPSQSSAVIDLTGDTPPASQPGPPVQEEDDGARFQRNREAREARYHYCVGDGAYQSGGASRQTHRLDTPPGNPLSLGSRLAEVSASTSANAEPGAGSGEQHGQAGPREEE